MENKTYIDQILDIQRMLEGTNIVGKEITLTEAQVSYLRVCSKIYGIFERQFVKRMANALYGSRMNSTTGDEIFTDIVKDISE